MTQNNLGIALSTLGERQRDKARLVEAKKVIRVAHDIYREADMTQYDNAFKESLQKIDNLLQQLP